MLMPSKRLASQCLPLLLLYCTQMQLLQVHIAQGLYQHPSQLLVVSIFSLFNLFDSILMN